jgi:hypothetical protein
MAAVPKPRTKAPRLRVDYDCRDDVMYVLNGKPRPAEGEDLPGGIVRRYALEDNSPCGVTIIGYRLNQWPKKPREIAEIIAVHLGEDVDQVERLLHGAAGAGHVQLKS